MDFRFTNQYKASQLDGIVSYLMGPRLWIPQTDYPDFLDWAKRVHHELRRETKRALVCFKSGQIIGVTIYQKHKSLQDHIELKNITVRPEHSGRYIASFLVRNTEVEARAEFGSKYIICDAKVSNRGITDFLSRHHYSIIGKDDLYSLKSGDDLLFRKTLASKNNLYT